MPDLARRLVPAAVVAVAVATGLALWWWPSEAFESRATYVMRVIASDENDRARAIANLGDERKVPRTYALAMESDLIEGRALEAIGARSDATHLVDVDADLAPGTSIIEIRLRGDDADTVAAMAGAVGDEAIRFAEELEDLYVLEVLDPPAGAVHVSPALSLSASTAVAAAGLGAAWFTDRLLRRWGRRRRLRALGIDDSADLDEPHVYTRQRLREEQSRADHGGPACRMIVMRVRVQRSLDARGSLPSEPRRPDPERIRRRLQRTLRPQDHLCAIDDRGTYAVLLPGMSDADVQRLAEDWQAEAADQLRRRRHRLIDIRTASCRYADHDFVGERDAIELLRNL